MPNVRAKMVKIIPVFLWLLVIGCSQKGEGMAGEPGTVNLPQKTLVDSIWIKANPERVFRALTIGEEICKWFPDEAETMPELGGKVVFKWNGASTLNTTFLSFEKNKEVSYGFFGGDIEPVKFLLKEEKGGTRLDLEHFIPEGNNLDMLIDITKNWAHILNHLKMYIEQQLDIR